MRFKVGDRVVKNPLTWKPSEFDGWGAGEGVGVIVEAPLYGIDDGLVDVRWPAGRCSQHEDELILWEEPS